MAGLPFENIFKEVLGGQRGRLFSYEPHNSTFYNVSGIARLVGTVWFLGFSVVFLAFYLNTKLNASPPPPNGSPSDEGGEGSKADYFDYYPHNHEEDYYYQYGFDYYQQDTSATNSLRGNELGTRKR